MMASATRAREIINTPVRSKMGESWGEKDIMLKTIVINNPG